MLVPIYLGVLRGGAEPRPGRPDLQRARLSVLLAFLGQFAVYRARRYRLTRTIYRGVRFHQDGSALRYAVCALFWWILIALTLGLAYPFAQSRLERFKMRHTYYGDLPGRFEGSGLRLFVRGLPMWLLVIGPLVVALIYAVADRGMGPRSAAAAQRRRLGSDSSTRSKPRFRASTRPSW